MLTTTPATADEAASIFVAATRDGQRVAIHGAGTKTNWAPADAPDVVLSTLGLNRIVAHRHGDLTATIEAGARLADVNRALASHRQWLALDPAWSDRATIGGIVATNDAGPRRHRYGAPRDVIIGVDIVRADGVRAKAGGIVVKNVAGYDLARLMTGSFGSLALISSATFKLYPIPAASRTVVVDVRSPAEIAAIVGRILSSQLTPTAVEVQSPPPRLLIRFESTEASVGAQAGAVVTTVNSSGNAARVLDAGEEERTWSAHCERPWNGSGAVLKITFLPGEIGHVLEAIQNAAGGAPFDLTGRAGVGALHVRLDLDHQPLGHAVDALRARVSLVRGSVLVLRGPDALRQAVSTGAVRGLMQSVKRAFDPSGVLAYRGVY